MMAGVVCGLHAGNRCPAASAVDCGSDILTTTPPTPQEKHKAITAFYSVRFLCLLDLVIDYPEFSLYTKPK